MKERDLLAQGLSQESALGLRGNSSSHWSSMTRQPLSQSLRTQWGRMRKGLGRETSVGL